MTTSWTVALIWKDEHLVWNPANYGGMERANFAIDELWKPDFSSQTSLPNLEADEEWMREHLGTLRVESNGLVKWRFRLTLKTVTILDLSDFPVDTQHPFLRFVIQLEQANSVNLTAGADFKYRGHLRSNEWTILQEGTRYESVSATFFDEQGNKTYSDVELVMKLQRFSTVFTYYLDIPRFVATFLALAAFGLPLHAKARLLLRLVSIFILLLLLAFVSTIIGVHSSTVPKVVKSISWNAFVVAFVMIVEQVSLVLLSRLKSKCPELLRNLLTQTMVSKLLCLSTTARNPRDGQSLMNESDVIGTSPDREICFEEWNPVAQALDRLLLVSYALSLLLFRF